MRFVYFTHSLRSCWNHGNAHFLRGVLRELIASGHEVRAYEPEGAWSLVNLLQDAGEPGLDGFREHYPELRPTAYDAAFDLDAALDGADVVIVHEWNEPRLVAAVGALRRRGGRFTLLFHDTHHRAVSEPAAMRAYDLDGYDGVLAFGATLAAVYRGWGWGRRVFVWHEAADTRLFRPPSLPRGPAEGRPEGGSERGLETDGDTPHPDRANPPPSGPAGLPPPRLLRKEPGEEKRRGLVWIGNWGDDERSEELETFLLGPAERLGLALDIYGVRYPEHARATLAHYGAAYRGWLPNSRAPEVFARHLATVHVPRRFYVERLPGIPTIRVFEALACGIPLVSAPWSDSEGLFRVGSDFLMARDGAETERHLAALRDDPELRASLVTHGLETIRARHTCAHRAAELTAVVAALRTGRALETA